MSAPFYATGLRSRPRVDPLGGKLVFLARIGQHDGGRYTVSNQSRDTGSGSRTGMAGQDHGSGSETGSVSKA